MSSTSVLRETWMCPGWTRHLLQRYRRGFVALSWGARASHFWIDLREKCASWVTSTLFPGHRFSQSDNTSIRAICMSLSQAQKKCNLINFKHTKPETERKQLIVTIQQWKETSFHPEHSFGQSGSSPLHYSSKVWSSRTRRQIACPSLPNAPTFHQKVPVCQTYAKKSYPWSGKVVLPPQYKFGSLSTFNFTIKNIAGKCEEIRNKLTQRTGNTEAAPSLLSLLELQANLK